MNQVAGKYRCDRRMELKAGSGGLFITNKWTMTVSIALLSDSARRSSRLTTTSSNAFFPYSESRLELFQCSLRSFSPAQRLVRTSDRLIDYRQGQYPGRAACSIRHLVNDWIDITQSRPRANFRGRYVVGRVLKRSTTGHHLAILVFSSIFGLRIGYRWSLLSWEILVGIESQVLGIPAMEYEATLLA